MNRSYLIFVTLILSIIISANLSIFLDIPYFRQILPFILLTFVPGLLMIQILKLNHINIVEKIALSVGLSLILVTFTGMVTNYIFFSLKPLDLSNILIIFNILLVILLFLGYLINRAPPINISGVKFPKHNSYEKVVLIVAVLLPTLSMLGTFLVKMNGNYVLLYLMIFLIPTLVIFMSITNRNFKEKYYLISIFSISFSLILAYTLISNYIYGTDSHTEFYFYKTIVDSGKWHLNVFTTIHQKPLSSCLIISIFPAVYQIISRFPDPTLLFKLIFVLPLSLIPLIVYQISKTYNNKEIYSFLAAIFVISAISFYSQTEAYRTYIAVLFFALAIMVFLSPNLNNMVKKLLFIIFTIGIIVSHYSSGYVFFFIMLSSVIIIQCIKFIIKIKKLNTSNETNSSLFNKTEFISVGLLILSFVIMFVWYSQITGTAFDSGINYLVKTLGRLNDFFIMESRDPTIYQAMGSTLSNAPLIRYINFFTSWASIGFIAVGILTALISMLNFKMLKRKLKLNSSSMINLDFLGLSISSFVIMVAAVILPFVLVFYSLPRLYYFLIVILSIFFILGGKIIAKNLKVKKPYILILVILIPILLSNIGITPQFFGAPNSILLNPSDNINNTYYVYDSEAYGAAWIGNYRDLNNKFYTDSRAAARIVSIGLIPRENIIEISKYGYSGYTYLSYYNIKQGELYFWKYTTIGDTYDIKEYSDIFDQKNRVYDSGNSEILFNNN